MKYLSLAKLSVLLGILVLVAACGSATAGQATSPQTMVPTVTPAPTTAPEVTTPQASDQSGNTSGAGMMGGHDMSSMMPSQAPTDTMSGGDMGGMLPSQTPTDMMPGSDMGGMMGGHDMGSMMGGDGAADGHGAAIPSEGVQLASERRGGQPLSFTQEGDVKVFQLTARPVRWPILTGATVTAWTYNGTVPGPMIRVTEGDKLRVILKNELPEATSIHWHGLPVPNSMDGVPPFTQKMIEPGETFTYEFTATQAGSFMYHSHVATDKQIPIGLYAPLIIDPKTPEQPKPAVDEMLMLSEWRIGPDGETYPAMPMAGAEPNYFTINGKAFPETESIKVKVGDVVRLRLAGIGQFAHPMHLHGMSFKVVAVDGNPVPEVAQLTRDTITVNPGERYDIEFKVTEPGVWIMHCHILHHVTNDSVEPGGLIYVINVEA
jgi:FtsP/CotA-like multicopper oxidase with cupredoxin domain